ncbi:EamA-like transporter family protein [Arthrobacter sp. yr096]|uniref:DMT family transporter n=1 Tax=unclassified Arthrobacter TaxID=235627 RepID=UPI00089A48AF|nr:MULTISPECIES: DMT family transporter [unclassified Arthrobacter]SDX30570.1 EamA-like transporter family protein [Arthrobacter sp. cf158]SEJ52239.1 EamA-like transporter family protein [Arthrobacter sp. yr096]
MTLTVTAAVLLAAVLHSVWNAIAKAIPDRLASSTMIALAYLASGVVGAAIFGIPLQESWPYVLASAGLQTCYLILLTTSYKHGDFSQVYPLARGLAVLLVTAVATTFLAEKLSLWQLAGVAVVAGSLLSLALTRAGQGAARNRKGTLFAVLTGAAIAAYSLVDGVGVRMSGQPIAYISWLFLIQGLLIPVVCWRMASDRRQFPRRVARYWRPGFIGGLVSMLAYGIVVWAQSLAPLALVSALRETSVLLAGIIGAVFFKERFSRLRLTLTAVAVAGIAAIQLG